jgi:hypothetical protein
MVAGCGPTCVKYLFFTFNFLVFLCGGAILGLSLWVRFDSNFETTINKALADQGQAPLPVEMSNLYIVLYVIMGVGGLLILCGGLGCLGACCESPCLLGTFFTIILVLFLAEVAGAIYIFVRKDAIRADLSGWYKTNVVNHYSTNDNIRRMLDETQTKYQCCGASGCTDYAQPPESCLCLNSPNRPGCFDKIYDAFKTNITIVAIVAACLVAIEILAMIFACVLCSSIRQYAEY